MEKNLNQYMVEFTMPLNLPEEFVQRIPQQRDMVNRLFQEGKVLSYALSLESGKLWSIFAATSETELMQLVQRLPLTRYMKLKVNELTFYNASHPFSAVFSMN
jgi:muconolactone delta-isomerase